MVAGLLCGGPARIQAQVLANGSFEADGGGFGSWTTLGTATAVGGKLTAPVSGSFQAMIVAEVGGSIAESASALSAFFDGASLPTTGTNRGATTGSGIRQTFTLTQPATLTFSYKYVTNEGAGSGYDSAFFFNDGSVVTLASSTSAGLNSAGGVGGYANGLNYVTATVQLASGTHTIGFGVYNTANKSGSSAIFIDQVFTTSAIPEPAGSTFIVALSGMGLAVWRARRRAV